MLRFAGIGAATALGAVFPVAALVALCYRFPIPFVGYESGPVAMVRSPIAVVFYGLLGGFVVIAACGAVSGAVAHQLSIPDVAKARRITVGLAIACDFILVMILAVLDKLIGRW